MLAIPAIAPPLLPENELRYVDVLTPSLEVPSDLVLVLRSHGFDLRHFDDVEAWAEAMKVKQAAALLVQSSLLMAACATIDALAQQAPGSATTVIVGIGQDRPGERLQALLQGAGVFFDRFDDASLADRLLELIQHPTEEPYKILIVDDSAATRMYLRAVLEHAGMLADECADPRDVLDRIVDFQPDLLLVDLHMPGMDGMTLTMRIRQQPGLSMLPIIFLSIQHNDETRFRAIQAGGDDFLAKPARPRALIATVRSRVKRMRAAKQYVPKESGTAPKVGQLRRGDFLTRLGEALRGDEGREPVLMSIKIDQAHALGKLGMTEAFQLEQAVAQCFAKELRESDAYTSWLEYGFGILASRSDLQDISLLAQRITQAVADRPFSVRGQDTQLTLSIGMALAPIGPDALDTDRWLSSAYAAQSIAHRHGGNRHEGLLTREHGAMPPERVLMIREWVDEAAKGENIVVEFQPMLPIHGHAGMYAIAAKLRDFRAPLGGATREEYLVPARAAGALKVIERVGLFHAFDAIEEQRLRGHATRVLAPLDMASLDEAQTGWLYAELRRRKTHATELVIEVDADSLLEDPARVEILRRLRENGVGISIADRSGGLARIPQLLAWPADFLRLPFGAVVGVPTAALAELLGPWLSEDHALIVDRVENIHAAASLWSLGKGYLQGDALAACGPRLDYQFVH